ncbi:thiol-disulfide oxidoreductase DCC family protein [Streptomyces sp. GC420]|uniref:thiol-disulfide oxidoreductase DCC family protein n=1 Tax=Streptomyces sp. GC420 TaxID=2697568 RepID=UPI0014150AD9|nr:DCC1-like thiol-disulfide oxidoreductase family protein [Streptomyces sp. GC420]NBM18316.1 DUF393 domain-containing protein [Streptomyces sp. GC420]
MYDARCPLCTHIRDWLARQRRLVPLVFVPAGSDEARKRLPALDHGRTLKEITVVADGGQVYEGAAAWVVCLWALAEYRPMSHRLSTPAGALLARGAVLAAARYREARREAGWGGGVYSTADGWLYDPAHGWTHGGPPRRSTRPPRRQRSSPSSPPPACDGACPAPD